MCGKWVTGSHKLSDGQLCLLILQSIFFSLRRWQLLELESGTRRWKDNSCKCHQGGQGLTSLKLPVGETDGREHWHLSRLEPRDVLHINMQTHLIRFIWPRVFVFKPVYCDSKGQSRARLRLKARLLLGHLFSLWNLSSYGMLSSVGYLTFAVITFYQLTWFSLQLW